MPNAAEDVVSGIKRHAGKEYLFLNFNSVSVDEAIARIDDHRNYIRAVAEQDRLMLVDVTRAPMSRRGFEAWQTYSNEEPGRTCATAVYGPSASMRLALKTIMFIVRPWFPDVSSRMQVFKNRDEALAWLCGEHPPL